MDLNGVSQPLRHGLAGHVDHPRIGATIHRQHSKSTAIARCVRVHIDAYNGAAAPVESGGGNGGGGGIINGNTRFDGAGDGDAAGDPGNLPWQLLFPLLCLGTLLSIASPAQAVLGVGKKKRKPVPQSSAEVDKLVDLSWPIFKNLGFSGVLGVIAAIALKTVGRSLAVVVGGLFAVVQVGAYMGYVTVDWARVHKDVIRSFDVNHNGTFDVSDYKSLVASLLAILSQGVPSLGGFLAGFMWALRL